MMKTLHIFFKAYFTAILFITCTLGMYAQEQTITGTVTDSNTGETLVGVNITTFYDRGIGTITDIDGNYTLTISDTVNYLYFSYVGYTSQTIAIVTNVINVQLVEGEVLQEVVIIGYGTRKTKEVTSAVARVKSEDFNDGNINDPIQLIQGKVAGVSISRPGGDPNSDFDIRIRGLSTFGSNTEPLIIIDGVQGTVDLLKSLDPDDVASFDILKDASAAAIYGTRAASGVVIITTKKGEYVKGEASKFNVEFNASLTSEMVSKNVASLTTDEYLSFNRSTNYNSSTNWMDAITQTAFQQAYNLAVMGASKRNSFRVAFNYRDGSGVVRETGFQQLNGRINFTQITLDDMLTLDFNLAATLREETYTQGEALTFAARYNPSAPVMATTDTLDAYSAEWGGYFQRQAFDFYNPSAIVEQGTLDGRKTNLVGSIKGVLEPIKGLKLSGFGSITQANELYGSYWSKNALWTPYGKETHKGFARKETKDNWHKMFEATASYNKRWEKVDMTVIAGYSYQDATREEFWAYGEGFLTDGFTYNNLGSASVNKANKETMSSYKATSVLKGYFARASFTFIDGIYLTGSVRWDGSSMFGKNNKWGTFPAISAGVDLARFLDLGVFNQLKLRGGYGITGNLPPEAYLSLLRFNVTNEQFFYNGEYIQAYAPVRNPNPDLKWETKAEIDIGVDFSLLDYKLTGTIDYYQSASSDLLLEFVVPVPPNLSDRMWLNLGELKNSGLEFLINYKVYDRKKWGWTTSLNFSSYFETKLEKITSDLTGGEGFVRLGDLGAPFHTNTFTIYVEEGNAIGQIVAPQYYGIDTAGTLQYYTANDSITSNPDKYGDYVVVGNGLPDFEFGWGNTFRLWGFNVSFFLRGVFGHSLLNVNNARYGVPNALSIQNVMQQALDYKDATNGPVYSDVHVEKADFVTLDNFSISYQFNFPDSKYLAHLNVYFSGQNLFTITNYSGVSPEVRYGDSRDNNNPLAPGIDREDTYFRTRSFTLGASILF